LEVALKVLSHPIVFHTALTVLISAAACVVAIVMVRRLRRNLTEEDFFMETTPSLDQFPMHTYNAVIQQLKQQKHELMSVQQVERRRAKTSENISAAVLSNLSSGVLFLSPNGLVRKANTAAKDILGFASPVGLSMEEAFRDATVISLSAPPERLAAAVQSSLRELTPSRSVRARYVTPAGEERTLEITLTPVFAPSGETLGAACLINDRTEIAQIQRQQELRGEMSAEMALALRNSLATIAGYAQQLAASRDPELARQLAADIASEAAQLDHSIGGFLAGARAKSAAAGT